MKITQKAGVDGRLFGSITNADIAEELVKAGFAVHKAQVRMPNGPIKMVGDATVVVALHTDVSAEVTVSVYGDHSIRTRFRIGKKPPSGGFCFLALLGLPVFYSHLR